MAASTKSPPETSPRSEREQRQAIERLKDSLAAKQLELEECLEREDRLLNLLQDVDEVVWTASVQDSRMLYVNSVCETVYGRPPEDFYANADLWLEAVHPEDRERVREGAERLFELGRIEQEYRIIRADGEVRWLSDRKQVIFDKEGQPSRIGGLAADITDQVWAREERREFIRELESRNAELEHFTYAVSHDLKSPLVTIRGFLAHLEDDLAVGETERTRQDIAHIRTAAEHMDLLLRDLLEFSRVGHLASTLEKVPLSDLAQEAASVLSTQLRAGEVEVEISPEMPVVLGDRIRLLQVFQNLIENAAKFMGNQASPRLQIGSAREGAEMPLYVRDNGAGIDPRHQQRIFRVFEQIDNSSEGTGIGLALVRRIIEAHGGRVWIESEGLGHGCTVWFTLTGAPGLEGYGA